MVLVIQGFNPKCTLNVQKSINMNVNDVGFYPKSDLVNTVSYLCVLPYASVLAARTEN